MGMIIRGSGIFPRNPVNIASGQSETVGIDTNATGWPGPNSQVVFQDDQAHLFVLGPRPGTGQFGPELTFANGLCHSSGNTVYFFKNAIVNTPITSWIPGGANWPSLVTTLQTAAALPSGVDRFNFDWDQGQFEASNAGTYAAVKAAYKANMAIQIAAVRAILPQPTQYSVTRINLNQIQPGGPFALNGQAIYDAHTEFVNENPMCVLISTDSINPGNTTPSNQHFINGQELLVGNLKTAAVLPWFYP